MKPSPRRALKVSRVVFSLIAVALACLSAHVAAAQQGGARSSLLAHEPPTARSGLEKARALATRWQPDAELRKISIPKATAEGLATEEEGWTYVFYSKRLRRSYEVSILGPMTMGAEGSDAEALAPLEGLPKDFTDSDKAVTAAREGGFQSRPGIRLTLSKRADEPATWEITSGNPVYLVDAESGKFLRVKE
ncbi:MAG: hypothetical protein ACRD4D_08410 [Candidatus Acidiferrales bacterium]